ncbi:hypothetical protein [Clostridium sp. AN503]|uniref:hypothetical protein n=1 Tax=Clostridium sp. AN503 TaxID=3160598 RepID=UPI003457DEBD
MKNNTAYKDVTEEVFGTKSTAEASSGLSAVSDKSAASAKRVPPVPGVKHVSELSNPVSMPVPVETSSARLATKGVVSAETTESLKQLDKLFRSQTKDFVAIGYELLQFRQNKRYKELGFATFEDFISGEMKLSKSAAYNYINVCCKYSVRDENNKPTAVLGKEYSRYSSSQLIVMLSLDKDKVIAIDPDTSIKEMKKLTAKEKPASAGGADFSDTETEKGGSVGSNNAKKKNTRDMTVPVNRLSMASGLRWEDVVTDKTKNACLAYLTDDRRAADGKEYKIEICITYPDTGSM